MSDSMNLHIGVYSTCQEENLLSCFLAKYDDAIELMTLTHEVGQEERNLREDE